MKYKLKTRLFAALALSGVSFYWPTSEAMAQKDEFGFIRLAEPSRQIDHQQTVPPISQANPMVGRANSVNTQVLPPIVSAASNSAARNPNALPPITAIPNQRSAAKATTPMPFAVSNVFNGAYVESNAGKVGYAQHVSPAEVAERASSRQVAYNEPAAATTQAPIVSGIQAQRDLPPIVSSAQSTARRGVPQIIQPIEQNEVPPILSSAQAASGTALPPVVTPKAGLDRLLNAVPATVADSGMIQDQYLLNADGATLDDASKVQPAAFGASPMLIQDAPPIIDGGMDSVTPGALPSARGVLVPVDPTVEVPFDSGVETFPRAMPLDSNSMAPRSVIDPQTQPRQTYFEPTAQPPAYGSPVMGGCSTCGTSNGSCGCNGGGVSGCSSCGDNGCFDQAAVDNMFNTSGSNAYARQYFIAEGLYLDRNDGSITNSNFGSLNDFDGAGGARITIGRRQDSTSGREFQYSGIEALAETINNTSADGGINSLITTTGGLSFDNVRSFFNATEQEQSKETYFHSLEFNKVKWGWDVIKSYVGLRYLYIDDEYTLFSQSAQIAATDGTIIDAERGEFQVAASNNLIGPQIGGELYYDVGYRWSLSGFSRLGAYANLNQVNTRLINDGDRFIDTEDTNATFAYTYEAGINAKYRITSQAQFRVGYNIYYWDNLATASNNLSNDSTGTLLSPSFGTSTSDSDDMFLHGLSFGFELYR